MKEELSFTLHTNSLRDFYHVFATIYHLSNIKKKKKKILEDYEKILYHLDKHEEYCKKAGIEDDTQKLKEYVLKILTEKLVEPYSFKTPNFTSSN